MVRSLRHPIVNNERGDLMFFVYEDVLLGSPFYFSISYTYSDKGCMDSQEERSHGGPTRQLEFHK